MRDSELSECEPGVTSNNQFDVIVLGLGAMGAATLDALATRGIRALGIERFGIPHEHGSSGGDTRLIRMAYYEHPDYVPLLRGAYEYWAGLEARTSEKVLFRTGIAQIGRADGEALAGARHAAALHGLRFESVARDDAAKRWPTLRVPDGYEAAWDSDGGFLLAAKSIRLFAECALRTGATVRAGECVIGWRELGDGVEVHTTNQRYRAARLVVTAGSWTSPLMPSLGIPLEVTRQPLFWTWPADPDMFSIQRHPCWFAELDGHAGQFYGFPMLGAADSVQLGFKIAHHVAGRATDPDHVDAGDVDEFEPIRDAMGQVFRMPLGDVVAVKVCRYTSTTDQHFVVDHYPGSQRVVVACGFSGHGFKFASVMGEILADLAVDGATKWPIEFLKLQRFR